MFTIRNHLWIQTLTVFILHTLALLSLSTGPFFSLQYIQQQKIDLFKLCIYGPLLTFFLSGWHIFSRPSFKINKILYFLPKMTEKKGQIENTGWTKKSYIVKCISCDYLGRTETLQQRACAWNSHCFHKGAVWFHCRGRDEPLHTNSQQIHHFITLPFLSILPSLLTPAFLQPLGVFFFVRSHTSCCISADGALTSTFKRMQMLLLQTGWCHRLRRSERLRVLSDLLVCAAPDPLYFLRGSWEIHLCLLLAGFVFGICRFPQSWKPKKHKKKQQNKEEKLCQDNQTNTDSKTHQRKGGYQL